AGRAVGLVPVDELKSAAGNVAGLARNAASDVRVGPSAGAAVRRRGRAGNRPGNLVGRGLLQIGVNIRHGRAGGHARTAVDDPHLIIVTGCGSRTVRVLDDHHRVAQAVGNFLDLAGEAQHTGSVVG